jgi:mono/diheme cytochrome c family protein
VFSNFSVHVFLLRSIVLNVSTVLPNRRCVLKNKAPLILLALLAVALALWAQKDQPPAKTPTPESKIPPEEAAKANPVKPTPESLAKGKKMYGIDCAMCHGNNGDGKGDIGGDYKNMPDFTNPDALKNRTDGELFYITRNGKGGDMPPEDNRAKDDDIWNMVNYVRSFKKK